MDSSFRFKQFSVHNEVSAMKVGTDGVLLGAWTSLNGDERAILDVGTGTGVIALMMAQRHPSASVIGIDIDAPSAVEASSNFEQSPWSSRLKAECADFRNIHDERRMSGGTSPFETDIFDLVVSNPPFFTNALKAPSERRTAARHNDTLSHTDLIDGVVRLLAENGRLAVVLPSDEGELFIGECRVKGLALNRICKVRTKPGAAPKRYLMEFSKNNERLVEETLIIQNRGEFTEEYKRLTSDFYLAF